MSADDVEEAVALMVTALSARLDRDWHVPAGPLTWDCWETVEHLDTTLAWYAVQLVPVPEVIAGRTQFDYVARRPDGPEEAFFAPPDAGPAGLLRILNACGGLLASMARTAAPELRAPHMWGDSDPAGFAAMGVVETLAHFHDVAVALDVDWSPSDELCARTLARLFPHAPTDTPPAETLLWATGRATLPGHPRLDDWRWYGKPR